MIIKAIATKSANIMAYGSVDANGSRYLLSDSTGMLHLLASTGSLTPPPNFSVRILSRFVTVSSSFRHRFVTVSSPFRHRGNLTHLIPQEVLEG